MKRIIICSDGTWNRPETKDEDNVFPTNVIKFARGIAPVGQDNAKQIVFYDWGIGSYHDKIGGGAFANGLEKNVMDAYRFIVHNYEQGDELFFFGFSRGAYTVRSLSGMINNCHILKSTEGHLIEEAFDLYKNDKVKPNDQYSIDWRAKNAIPNSGKVKFIGVWDTVGSIGVPITFYGLLKKKHVFYDNHIGGNIEVARHALSLDENRKDFEPTIWQPKPQIDLKQVWFAGVHSDVGGGYDRFEKRGKKISTAQSLLSDIPMEWMMREAQQHHLKFDDTIDLGTLDANAEKHNELTGIAKLRGKHIRKIPSDIPTKVHKSVKERYAGSNYKSTPIQRYLRANGGQWPEIEE